MGLQVDVCVQDCYTPSDQTDRPAGDLATAIAAIPEQQWQTWFQRWLEQLQPELSPVQAYELSLRLTCDRDMQSLNAQYRHQDRATDVLAFAALEADTPANPDASDEPLYLGDIVISVDTAHQQAIVQGHDLVTELAWLASHGLLHLLGWDHPDDNSLIAMLTQQKALLNTVGLSTAAS